MNAKTRKHRKLTAKEILLRLSWAYVIILTTILLLSILFTVLSNLANIENSSLPEWLKYVDVFSTSIADNSEMNIPFSILIQLLTTFGGVFFGLRIDQWINEKEEEEKLREMWKRINKFLYDLQQGITEKSIHELSEFKLYWNSIQNADHSVAKRIQEDDVYSELSVVFSFLSYYENSWSDYPSIDVWKNNVNKTMIERITNWKKQIDKLIEYSRQKSLSE